MRHLCYRRSYDDCSRAQYRIQFLRQLLDPLHWSWRTVMPLRREQADVFGEVHGIGHLRRSDQHGGTQASRLDVETETLYEAAGLGLARLKKDGWIERRGPGSRLEIHVRQPSTVHILEHPDIVWLATPDKKARLSD